MNVRRYSSLSCPGPLIHQFPGTRVTGGRGGVSACVCVCVGDGMGWFRKGTRQLIAVHRATGQTDATLSLNHGLLGRYMSTVPPEINSVG